MREHFVRLVLGFPASLVLVAMVVTLMAAARLYDPHRHGLDLPVDASLSALLPSGGSALATYERTAAHYGSDDVLFVAWRSEHLFSVDVLIRLKRLVRRLEQTPGVRAVDSLNAVTEVREVDGYTEVTRVLRDVPSDEAGLAALRRVIEDDPLQGARLLSADGKGTLIVVQLEESQRGHALDATLAAIRAAAAEEAEAVEQWVTGPVAVRHAIGAVLFTDMRRALPLAVLVTTLVAAVTLRSVRGVLLPLGAIGGALAITLSVFTSAGHALNFVTVIMPPVVFVVGFALAVHVINEFDTAYRDKAGKRTAVAHIVRELFVPLSLTAFTTAVGFLSLATSNIESIRVFGLYTALGTLLSWAATLVVMPAALLILPARVRPDGAGRLAAFAPSLAGFDLVHRRAITCVALVLAGVSLVLALRIEVSTDYLGNFAPDHPVRRDFERIRTYFGGANPLQILIESDVPQAFADPVHLASLAALQDWLGAQDGVGTVSSFIDLLAVGYRVLEPDLAAQHRVPPTREAVEDVLNLSGGDARQRFLDARQSSTVMHLTTSAVATRELAALIAHIEARLAELPGHMHAQVTGSAALLARTLDDVVRGQVLSLAGALCVIYGILVVLFGSFRVAAIALLPNALPIVAFFGVLGLSGVSLNLATSLVAAVVLGIAVDDSIHFLSRFNAEARRTAREEEGIASALQAVIRPVTTTTLALCCGFLTLTTGELRSQVEFGALAAAMLAFAWVLDLVFTPAISHRLRFVTLWEVLTVDLGTAPHRSIPLFAGLSHRQARIAAILGRLETFAAGTRVMQLGTPGQALCLVIDGELDASVPRDDGDQLLRTLRRGDLFGEVALFQGHRTANVDARDKVRVLTLDQAALDRIAQRYPRIAAVIYRNLGAVLAARVEDLTGRVG